jgi:transposase
VKAPQGGGPSVVLKITIWLVRGGSPLRCNEAPVGRGGLPRSLASGSLVAASVCHAACAAAAKAFPHLRGLQVDGAEGTAEAVVIFARSRSAGAACPWCGTWSARVHSRYARRLADGATGGRPVVICLTVRRLACGNPGCAAVTFAEQVDGLSGPYLRRSLPLLRMPAGIGLGLAGRAGSRLAGALGIAVHPVTLLRLVAALPEPGIGAAPPVPGVDDFALRKSRVYGTVLVDLGTGAAIDLLPDREAATLEAWLKAHPGATVICRDRAGAYAEGARDGAPDAVQVADRWHLWHNLGEYVEKAVAAHRVCLTRSHGTPADDSAAPASPRPAAAGPGPPPAEPEGLRDVCGRQRHLAARTRDRHAAVHGLLAAGHPQRDAAAILGLSRNTVNRFAAAATPDELLVKATSRETRLDRCKPCLRQRWNEGITNAAALHAELQAKGWQGSVQAVARYVRPFRAMTAAAPPGPVIPKTRQITRRLLSRPDRLDDDERAQFADVQDRCPHLHPLAAHARSFAEIMTRRTGDQQLESWLAAVEADDQPELHSFANGIRKDHDAVTAGLTLPYSPGSVEGNLTRIKMIKRQMYGRASLALPPKRVILHPE